MIGPRTRKQRQRYLRHKVIAIVATFVLGYGLFRFLFPVGQREAFEGLESLVLRSPARAFEERVSGEMVHAVAVVEAAPTDSVPGWQVRALDGHPFAIVDVPGDFRAEPGDTIVVRGSYEWNTRGGIVDPKGTGPDSEGGVRPGFVRRRGEG
ncbi:MAG: hypothetical protein R3B81_04310 [bacterium]